MLELHIMPEPSGYCWEFRRDGKLIVRSGKTEKWTKDYATRHGSGYINQNSDKPFNIIEHGETDCTRDTGG